MDSLKATAGWSYLGDRKWADISREERFFCAHLYALTHHDPTKLIRAINKSVQHSANSSDWQDLAESEEWELAFEVCLFRDLRHHNLLKSAIDTELSLKRTFDLCLFSERRIVLIEAKAQQGFEHDAPQLKAFAQDLRDVAAALGTVNDEVPPIQLDLLLLASTVAINKLRRINQEAEIPAENYHTVTWACLSDAYGNDKILGRAERIYSDRGSSRSQTKIRGLELLNLAPDARPAFIGRGGGLGALVQDLPEVWKDRSYEVAFVDTRPNSNWFTFEEFSAKVRQ